MPYFSCKSLFVSKAISWIAIPSDESFILSATTGLHVSQDSEEKITTSQGSLMNPKSSRLKCPGTDHPLVTKFL